MWIDIVTAVVFVRHIDDHFFEAKAERVSFEARENSLACASSGQADISALERENDVETF